MGEKKEILKINILMMDELDAFDIILSKIEYTYSDLKRYKVLFTSEEDIEHYEDNVNKIYNILKTEVKDFFKMYYKDKIDEFE